MHPNLQHEPFKHVVVDNWPVPKSWPQSDHPDWLTYGSQLESKRALNNIMAMPADCLQALFLMTKLPIEEMLGLDEALVPDCSWWGAGCHEMKRGDRLSLHLDSSHSAKLQLARRANAILFVSTWQPEWGGYLQLWKNDKPEVDIVPSRGRLVVFECGDNTPHSVTTLLCPTGFYRRSLAVHFFSKPTSPGKRPRAQFLPMPNETGDLTKLREERRGIMDK